MNGPPVELTEEEKYRLRWTENTFVSIDADPSLTKVQVKGAPK